MDPNSLTANDWQQVVAAVNQLWIFAALVVVAALSFGLAQALIPSLMTTRQLPGNAGAVRPILYVISAVAMGAAIFTVVKALTLAYSVLGNIYPRWWV